MDQIFKFITRPILLFARITYTELYYVDDLLYKEISEKELIMSLKTAKKIIKLGKQSTINTPF